MLFLITTALAQGPFGTVGVVWTPALNASSGSVGPFFGPTVRAGWEFGTRFNHEITFQYTHAGAVGEASDIALGAGVNTYAAGYRFGVDFLGKEGFTPYIGVGLYTGWVDVTVAGGDVRTSTGGVLLELHGAAGARYTFESGLSLRAEVAGSTYGGLIGVQPSLGAGYQF